MTDEDPREYLARIMADRREKARIYLPGDRHFVVGRAEGAFVYAEDNSAYLDFGPGGQVHILGHGHNATWIIAEHLRHYVYTGEDHIARFAVEYAEALSSTFPSDDDGNPRQVLVLASEADAWRVARQHHEQIQSTGHGFDVDETRTGFGRTGTRWGFEQDNRPCPDFVVLGPAGAAGLPFAAVVAPAPFFAGKQIPPMGAHPVVCAVAAKVLESITDELLEHVRAVGQVFADGLAELARDFPAVISGSDGVGLAQQLFTTKQVDTQKFRDACGSAGVLMHSDLRLTPPLVVSEQEVRQALDVIADICLDWR